MNGIQRMLIEQQLAQIGLRTIPAQMNIELQRLKMRIRTELPQMEIDRKQPTFKMNRKKINSESGLKPPSEFSGNFAAEGRRTALEAMRGYVQDGNTLGDLRNPGDRVGRMWRSKKMAAVQKRREINIGLMPKSSPEVEWDKGHMRINWSKHSIVIDWDGEYMPKLTIDPKASVEVYLLKEPYFRITIEETPAANEPGQQVDEKV